MTNPFEDPCANYLVLLNDQQQYSLWPVSTEVPAGWRVVHQEDTYEASLGFIDANGTDLRSRV